MITTRVPAVIDALYTLITAAVTTVPAPPVAVYDGAPSTKDVGLDTIVVGSNFGDRLAVMGERMGPGGLTSHDAEVFQVGIVVECMRDVGETKIARDRAASFMALIETALHDDMRLGGACDIARVGPTLLWSQERVIVDQTEGIEVMLRFDVECRALLG